MANELLPAIAFPHSLQYSASRLRPCHIVARETRRAALPERNIAYFGLFNYELWLSVFGSFSGSFAEHDGIGSVSEHWPGSSDCSVGFNFTKKLSKVIFILTHLPLGYLALAPLCSLS